MGRDTRRVLRDWHCPCGRLLLRLSPDPVVIEIKCPKCKRINVKDQTAA